MKKVVFLILFAFSGYLESAMPEKVRNVAQETTQIYIAAMKTIFDNQKIINSVDSNKSHLFGNNFLEEVKESYSKTFKSEFPKADNIVTREMLSSMKIIMDSNKPLLLDKSIKVKGFIPAIFAFQLSQRFSNTDLPMRVKFTGFEDKLYNELNKPDPWEQAILKKIETSNWKKGKAHYEVTQEEVRYVYPLYHDKACLSCHGSLRDNPLNENQPKSKWTDTNIAGFKMQNFSLNQLGGGVSFAMSKTILERNPSEAPISFDQNLVFGVSGYSPYIEITNSGGIRHRWPQQFSKRVELDGLKLVNIPIKRLRNALKNNKIQLAFPVYDIDELQAVGKPITYEIPGLCFKKENFIPFLSATHQWKDLRIGFPGGVKLVSVLNKYNHNPKSSEIVGSHVYSRLVKMLMLDRFDAIYVQNINQIYSIDSENYDTVACSGFYGNLQPVYVATNPTNIGARNASHR
jgi:hypothetical protein